MPQSLSARLISAGFQKPEQALVALIAAQLGFWTLAPAWSHSAPPLDVVEMYAWGREGVVATFKHPNLPGLVLEGLRQLTGIAGWPAYLVSQLFVAATFVAVFALGRELMDARRALAGTLLLTGVYFFSWPTPEFNHNVSMMPLWALTAWMLWRATTKASFGASWLSWILLGLFGALSLWAKYSSIVFLVAAAAWILWDARARKSLLTPGPYLALLVFAGVAAPQALWLFTHDFQPLDYAARRSAQGATWFAPFEFLLTQVLNHLPMLVVLWCAGLFGKSAADAPQKPETRALRFLLLMGLAPVLLTAAGALIGGAGLKASWGSAMFNLSGLLAIALLSSRVTQARLGRVALGAGILIVLVSGLYFAHMRYGALLTDKPLRGNWPQAEVSAALEQQWREETGGAPLRIVAGDIWTAGLIGMSDAEPPSVLINGDFETSPWVTPQRIQREGMLLVWREGDDLPAPMIELRESAGERVLARLTMRFRQFPNLEQLRVNYVIVPPGAQAQSPLE
jgi:4-amino-4-deoxy-L-arabinose transferase-like glycosyltransferase